MILGVEISRLARSSKDWHQLLEICALFGTLIADSDGICDPADFNDRMLLGLKGTMSEAELHVIKQRMYQGKLSKARRGELGFDVPTGYVRSSSGEVVFDPDEEVQQVVRLIFGKFEELGTVHALLRYLVAHDVRIGVRVRGGEGKGELEWHAPNQTTLQNMLKNPFLQPEPTPTAGVGPIPARESQVGAPPAGLRLRREGGTSFSRIGCRPT
jgi:DNA invertase Pin-like site-specific DNA recombinase